MIHIRRCHACGHVNQNHQTNVDRCESCDKALAPYYFFNEKTAIVYSDFTLRPPLAKNEIAPLLGLSSYWEKDDYESHNV